MYRQVSVQQLIYLGNSCEIRYYLAHGGCIEFRWMGWDEMDNWQLGEGHVQELDVALRVWSSGTGRRGRSKVVWEGKWVMRRCVREG
jgi:hypothetical protein